MAWRPSCKVFSSADAGTVRTHFRWMHDYQIDGVFVQRFAVNLTHPALLQNHNKVLTNVRQAAVESKRVFAVMYDLTASQASFFRRLNLTGLICSRSLRSPKMRVIYTTMASRWWPSGASVSTTTEKYSLKQCYDLVATLKQSGCA